MSKHPSPLFDAARFANQDSPTKRKTLSPACNALSKTFQHLLHNDIKFLRCTTVSASTASATLHFAANNTHNRFVPTQVAGKCKGLLGHQVRPSCTGAGLLIAVSARQVLEQGELIASVAAVLHRANNSIRGACDKPFTLAPLCIIECQRSPAQQVAESQCVQSQCGTAAAACCHD
jgi:hypothetical protein